MGVSKGIFMVANSPDNEKNSIKWSNPLSKVIHGVKKFMKKEAEEEMKPSSFSTPINDMSPKLKQRSKSQTKLKTTKSEEKKTKRTERIRKDTDKEKKLPKKYRKGW